MACNIENYKYQEIQALLLHINYISYFIIKLSKNPFKEYLDFKIKYNILPLKILNSAFKTNPVPEQQLFFVTPDLISGPVRVTVIFRAP